MSEGRRRRGIPGTLGPGALGIDTQPRRGRVGEPNVLSDAAIPNQLSTEVVRPTSVRTSVLSGTREAIPAGMPSGTVTAKRRTGIPSLTTLLFLGFVALTAFRLFGQFVDSFPPADPLPTNAAPAATTPGPGGTAAPVAPGAITFGTASDGECGVTGEGVLFTEGTDVWWSAHMSALQGADAGAVVIVHRNDREIERQVVPAEPDLGDWDVLCSSNPVEQHIGGSYRLEVWDDDIAVLLAAGEYTLSG